MISVLLVDDRASMRQALRMRLTLEPDLMIIGEAEDGVAALELAPELRPDVVLMDIEMPRMDGIAAAGALRRLAPRSRVVMLSLYDDDGTRLRAHSAGAAAFIGKHEAATELLLATIRQVAAQA